MSGYATVPYYASGEVLRQSSMSIIENNINSGAWRLLDEEDISVAVNSVSFQDIPQTFTHLLIVALARTGRVNTADTLYLKINNNLLPNRTWRDLTNMVASSTLAGTGLISLATITGNSAEASQYAQVECWLHDYAREQNPGAAGTYRYGRVQAARAIGTSSGNMEVSLRQFRSDDTGPITRLDVGFGVGNLQAGSSIQLYGLPGMAV